MKDCIVLPVTETSEVGEARRQAVLMAMALGFNHTEQGKVAIVVTEVANNLIKHAKKGELSLRLVRSVRENGIEILALDSGPGMANVRECLQDGFSTRGTSGTGLGAIQRLCDVFDIHSVVGVGTALVAQLWGGQGSGDRRVLNSQLPSMVKTREQADFLEFGVVQLIKPGQEVCGDAWAVETQFERSLILVADGLGSGSAAAVASQEAVRILQTNALQSPKAILEIAHLALKGTRGAAVAIAEINPTQQTLRFAGIGNIAGVAIADTANHHLVSYNGIIGHQVRKIEEFVYPWSARSQLIMYSDGLGTQWSLNRYPGLLSRHPALVAGVLYRDFKRSHDDVTVLVAKMREIVSAKSLQ